jgi:hypothetical protein
MARGRGPFCTPAGLQALIRRVVESFEGFVRDSLPSRLTASEVAVRTKLLLMALETFGKSVADQRLPRREVVLRARNCADITANFVGIRSS